MNVNETDSWARDPYTWFPDIHRTDSLEVTRCGPLFDHSTPLRMYFLDVIIEIEISAIEQAPQCADSLPNVPASFAAISIAPCGGV